MYVICRMMYLYRLSLHPKIKSKLKRRADMLWQQALRNPSTFAWKLVLHARAVEVKSLGITLRNQFSHRYLLPRTTTTLIQIFLEGTSVIFLPM